MVRTLGSGRTGGIGAKPLKWQFPDLYEICFNKRISVAAVVSSRGKKVGFCRTLWGPMLTDWERILNSCDQVRLLDSGDKVWWTLTQNGKFTVSSFYKKLMWQNVDFPHEFLWKIRIPLKI